MALRQVLHTAVLHGNVTDGSGAVITEMTVFVNANLSLPVVVVQATGLGGFEPALEWVPDPKSETDFGWRNTSKSGRLVAVASAQSPGDPAGTARSVLQRAAASDLGAMLASHSAWWASYWEESFVSLPVTRLEGFYFTEMCVR